MEINKLDRNMLYMFLGVFLMMACFVYFDQNKNKLISAESILAARIVLVSYALAFGVTMLAVLQKRKES